MKVIRPPILKRSAMGSVAILLISCGSSREDQASILKGEVPSTHTDTATLGQAFHGGKKKMLNVSCVTGLFSSVILRSKSDPIHFGNGRRSSTIPGTILSAVLMIAAALGSLLLLIQKIKPIL